MYNFLNIGRIVTQNGGAIKIRIDALMHELVQGRICVAVIEVAKAIRKTVHDDELTREEMVLQLIHFMDYFWTTFDVPAAPSNVPGFSVDLAAATDHEDYILLRCVQEDPAARFDDSDEEMIEAPGGVASADHPGDEPDAPVGVASADQSEDEPDARVVSRLPTHPSSSFVQSVASSS